MLAASVLMAAGAASGVELRLPENAAIDAVDGTTVVPITIADTAGVQGIAISLTYAGDIATATQVVSSPVASKCTVMPGLATPGMITIVAACPGGLAEGTDVPLFQVKFKGNRGGVTPLSFSAAPNIPNGCLLNEGAPTCEPHGGQLTVRGGA
ncbi:MAG: hypothetical protein AB7V27_12105 [Candidatus Binatia bacterium]